jgi:hypothetical protein
MNFFCCHWCLSGLKIGPMKNTLVALVAALVLSHSFALANDAAPAGAAAPGPVAAPAAPLPPAANGLNEAPANPNWQNLDASAGQENAKPAKKHAKKHAKAKAKAKAKKGHKARKNKRHH